jgi:hypothetical protein
MGNKAGSSLEDFIANIPVEKLSGFTSNWDQLYKDKDFRVDLQGV